MDFNKYPLCQGDIEISVPAGVTGNLLATLRNGETVLVPVRNGVIKVDELAAEHFLAGNKGGPLPGYSKFVVDADKGTEFEKKPSTPSLQTGLPTAEEIKQYLTDRKVAFHPNTGLPKLQGFYAAEKAKELEEAKNQDGPKAEIIDLVASYPTASLESVQATLPTITDVELIKQLVAAEANGEAREDFLKALEDRLAELTA
jgi:hypothetical protein